MKIFSGSSNPKLAKKIARRLKLKIGKIELSRFPNSESRVWVKEKVKNQTCILVQSFSNHPDLNLVEFCLIVDALKRGGARSIIGIIPWLGYCIQDRVFREGEALSAKVTAKLLSCLPLDKIVSIDIHNETTAGFFDISFKNLSAESIFLKYLQNKNLTNHVVVAPDTGALKNSTMTAEKLNLPLAALTKIRHRTTGKVSFKNSLGSFNNKHVLIFDDFISTGGTLMKLSKFLKKKGAKSISAFITHHLFVPGVQEKVEKSLLDRIFITDTIQCSNISKYKKLRVLSVADLIAKYIS